MEPYLIIFDIDETLYNNQEGCIPETTLVAINKLKTAGHTLAIATGRAPSELIDEVKILPIDFLILANGQLIMQNEDIIYENPIDIDIINEIVDEAKERGVYLGFNSATHSTLTGITDAMHEIFTKYYSNMPEISGSINNEPIYQIWYMSEDLTNITEKLGDKLRFIPWSEHGADVIPVGVSKAVGLVKALEAIDDVLPKKVVFFGDGSNDIELMEMADIGIAMGNATAAVKAASDFVTKNIEDDGIYYACEQLGLFEDTFRDDDKINALIAKLEDAIAAEPNIIDHYFKLKSLYSSYTRASSLAVKVLEDALVYFPDNVKLLVELATVCEFELEDYDKAKMYYERVLLLDATHDLASNALAILNDKSIHPD